MKVFRFAAVGWLAVCAAASTWGESVRVATFNLANYLVTDRVVEGVYRTAYPKPESQKAVLRRLLRSINADVIALQEIGPEPFLVELQRDLGREGSPYPYRAWMQGADTERHLAVLSRIPIAEILVHDDAHFSYFGALTPVRRGMLQVIFEDQAGRWSLYNLHLKSRWTVREDDPQSVEQRVGEAQALRDRIRQQLDKEPEALVLVAGDFNDTTASRTLARFTEVNRRPLLEMIPAVDSRGETWTHRYAREDLYSRSDYFLCTPMLLPRIRSGRGTIADTPEWMEASDHRLVWLDLDFSADGPQ